MSLAIKASQTGKPVGVLTGYAVLRRYSLISEQSNFIIPTPQSQRDFPELDNSRCRNYNGLNCIGQFVTILSVNKTRDL